MQKCFWNTVYIHRELSHRQTAGLHTALNCVMCLLCTTPLLYAGDRQKLFIPRLTFNNSHKLLVPRGFCKTQLYTTPAHSHSFLIHTVTITKPSNRVSHLLMIIYCFSFLLHYTQLVVRNISKMMHTSV